MRLCGAAFVETILGSLPLFLIDALFVKVFHLEPTVKDPDVPRGSFVGAIKDKFLVSTLPQMRDELSVKTEGGEEILRILYSRPKPNWTPPRVVHYLANYYRLDSYSRVPGPRPFLYTLRRLPAGVPGRSVLIYSPE